jgi:hypothetical protein
MPTAVVSFVDAAICPELSLRTLKRRVYQEGLGKWKAAKRPYLDPRRAQRRVEVPTIHSGPARTGVAPRIRQCTDQAGKGI